MFKDRCQQISLSNEDLPRAFSIMLAGSAQVCYYDELLEKVLSLEELATKVRTTFETPERTSQ